MGEIIFSLFIHLFNKKGSSGVIELHLQLHLDGVSVSGSLRVSGQSYRSRYLRCFNHTQVMIVIQVYQVIPMQGCKGDFSVT